jgi:pantetheine-phosphate adenylyltransferase
LSLEESKKSEKEKMVGRAHPTKMDSEHEIMMMDNKVKVTNKPVVAVFSGVFDPITEGHLDIIRRSAVIFNHIVVAVGTNPEKTELFTKNERVTLIHELIKDLPNAEVQGYEGLTIDFVKSIGGTVIIKGIRDSVDLRYELQQANTNRLAGGIETLLMLTGDRYALTSSSLIKQVASMGGDVSSLVPPLVAEKLKSKLGAAYRK